MMRSILALLVLTFFIGCADRGYTLDNANKIYQIRYGQIISAKNVQIEAGSAGSVIGGIVGLIIGSQIGEGKGNAAATLGGGLVGSILGAKVPTSGQQLDIRLDDGSIVTTIIRADGRSFYPGERVRLVLDKEKILRIERIQ